MSARRVALAAVLLVAAWLVVRGGCGPAFQALAYLLPTMLLLGTLWARRYPGEAVLLAAIGSSLRAHDRDGRVGGWTGGEPRALLPRGGRLIACSLAVRPPPAASALTI